MPIGHSLDIGLLWDGYNIPNILSRGGQNSMNSLELDKKKIYEYQQNREPYLMIDYATEVIPGKSAKGYKDFNSEEWFF